MLTHTFERLHKQESRRAYGTADEALCERLKSQNRVSTELEADWQSWQSCKQLHCL